jgi:hypothetical protein
MLWVGTPRLEWFVLGDVPAHHGHERLILETLAEIYTSYFAVAKPHLSSVTVQQMCRFFIAFSFRV